MTNKSKQKRVVDRVVTSGLALAFMLGLWFLFLWLYHQSGLGEPQLKPLILGLIALYAVLEIFIVIGDFFVDDNKDGKSLENY